MDSADRLDNNNFDTTKKAVRKYPLFVNCFFMKHVKTFMKLVTKEALGTDHYWGRTEFSPDSG